MRSDPSRRGFLAAGLALPAVAAQGPAKKVKLTYRALGKTGLKVTSLSYGCMTTSDQSVIERAADMGIVHFDTARSYQGGNNERMVGAALKSRRKQIVLSSKSGGKTKQEVLDHLDTSLKELGTDYLDVWYLHNRSTPAEAPDGLFEAQRIAKKAGKIRFAGLSSHYNMDQMMAYVVKMGQTDVFLTTYNFAMKNVALDGQAARVVDMGAAIQATRKAGIGIVVMKALAGGASRASRGDRLYGAASDSVVKTLAREGAPVAAIRWVLKNQSVDTTIVCMTDQDQLEQNVLAMAEPFSPSDEKLLSQQLASISPTYCRMCGSCGGVCDKGVPVPDMLRYVSYADGYGQFAMAREKFMEHSAEVRAIRCKDCGSCSVDCPYGVRVRDQVMRAQDLFA